MTFKFPRFSNNARKKSGVAKRHSQEKALGRRLRLESLESRELLATWTVNVATVTDTGYVDVINHTGDLRGILTSSELNYADTIVFDSTVFGAIPNNYLRFQTPDLVNRSINIMESIVIDGGIDTNNDGINDARVNIITEDPNTTLLLPDNGTSLFLIDDGVIGTNSLVTIRNLDITGFDNSAIITTEELVYHNGSIKDCTVSNGNGGAICCLTDEMLTIDNVSFEGNIAYSDGTSGGNGGAIYSSNFSIKNSLFQGSAAYVDGGAIYRDGDAINLVDQPYICTIESSRFLNNKAGCGGNGQGGAIANTGGDLVLISTTAAQPMDDFITEPGMVFKENIVTGEQIDTGCGGAIYNSGIIQFSVPETSSNVDEYYFLFIGNEAIQSPGATNGSGNGGAIYNVGDIANSDIATETSTFELLCSGNKADGDGGAIYNVKHLRLPKSVFESNVAEQNGGAIYSVEGDESYQVEIAPFSRFNNNTTPNGDGGAIFLDYSSLQLTQSVLNLENCTFTENCAKWNGGAIVVAYQSFGVYLINCHFDYNVAAVGGAISSSSTNLSIVDSSFGSNKADGSMFGSPQGVTMQGGALYCLDAMITRGIFANNSALDDGGAIYANNVHAQDSTFEFNTAWLNGGAIFSPGGVELGNTIFQYNRAGQHGGAVFSDEMLTITSGSFTANVAGAGIQSAANGRLNTSDGIIYELPAYTSDQGAGNISATNTGSYAAGSYDVAASNTNGGALACRGTTTITGTGFLDNVAGNGGAIFNSGFLTICNDSSFERNIAGRYGGAISSVASLIGDGMQNLTIEKTDPNALIAASFSRNIALGYGGAIGNWANATISDATFYDNAARQSGGAVSNGYASNTTENAMIMTNVVIGDVTNGGNSALYGGGVMNGGNLTLSGVVIEGNTAKLNGGGLSVTNNGGTSGGNVVFNDTNVIRNNTAEHWAGGLLASQYTTLTNNGNVYVDENTATELPENNNAYLYVSVAGAPFVYGPEASSLPQEFRTRVISNAAPIGVVDLSDVVSPKSIQEGCSTTLNAIGMDGAVYAYDTNGDGVADFETTQFLTADALSLSVGVHEVEISIYKDGNLVDTLNVSVEILDVAPTISVVANEFANGNILSLNLDVAKARAIERWTLNWGDGTIETFGSLGFALKATHYYESAETQKVYDVLLSVTDVEGFGAEQVYVLKQHVVECAPVLAPVFNAVADSVESEEPQTVKSSVLPFFFSNDTKRADFLSKSISDETLEREIKREVFASDELYSDIVAAGESVVDELAKDVWLQFQSEDKKTNDAQDDEQFLQELFGEQFDNLLDVSL